MASPLTLTAGISSGAGAGAAAAGPIGAAALAAALGIPYAISPSFRKGANNYLKKTGEGIWDNMKNSGAALMGLDNPNADAELDADGNAPGDNSPAAILRRAMKTAGRGLEGLNKQRNTERDRSVQDAQRFGGLNLGGVAPVMGPVQPLPIPDFTPIQSPSQLKRFF